jgi:hypothetical protein
MIRAIEKAGCFAGLFLDDSALRTRPPARHLNYAFFGAIASFAAFATRNFTTVFALI